MGDKKLLKKLLILYKFIIILFDQMIIIKEKIDLKLLVKKYGISNILSNFFLFKLEDNIFKYSSSDIDKYKIIKQNNIICYIFFLLLININTTQILQFSFDKMCNYFLFDKYKKNM